MRRSAAVVLACLSAPAFGAGDAPRGAQLFRQCAACHSMQPGEHMTGPSLAKLFGHKAGTGEGFMRYSEAIKRADVTWNETTLDRWLSNPEKFIPGNTMTFAGVRESQARQDLIAYLKAVAENKMRPKADGGAMKGMSRSKADLKNVPAAGQVRSVKYCGDTYTVETADGKVEKVWEFNLRFKSDSSKFGPAPGKPVVVGAGMQGDRASIVFSSPREISETVKQSCP